MTPNDTVSRRSVLRTGAAAAGALSIGTPALLGQTVADTQSTTLQSKIEGHGHYQWWPFGRESWGRSANPYDMQDGDSRWLAKPQSDGSVRVLGKNFGTEPPNRSTGFDIHLGRLRTIETATVTARTLQTARTTGPAELAVFLYLDKDDNGEFFTWQANDDGTESPQGLGNDDEALYVGEASGELTIDGDTAFMLLGAETETTLADLQNGNVEGVTGETPAALYVGVINRGEGTDEIVVDDVRVQRA